MGPRYQQDLGMCNSLYQHLIVIFMHSDHLTLTRLRTVRNRVWEARSKWKDIGIELKLEQTDLDAVSSKNGSDADACFGDMLSKWLKQTRSRPTWLKMIRALKRPAVGFQELAEQIESEMNSVPKQRVELLQFPHNMIEPDEESREELQGRLRENTRDIVREFNILRHKLFDMLDQGHYSVPKLAGYLKDYDADKLTTLDEVQAFIESNSSFYDYEIVKYIIQLAGSERDEERLLDYEKHFEIYAQCRVYKIQSPATSPSNPGSQSSKLRIMLDSEYDKLQCNPNKLKQFQYRICNLLKIPMGMLVFIDPKVVA